MSRTTTQAGRAPRKRTRYDGRSWGSKPTAAKPEGPSKREQAAETALADVLALFESGELPEKIALTVIARQEGVSPMVNWSLGNQLIALLSGSTDCRGFNQWKQVGRHVTKGSKAVYILGPKSRKITDRDAESGEESERVIVTGFVGIPVFRYEDTEGAVLDVPDYMPAAFPPLYDVAERLGIPVRYAPFAKGARGWYQPRVDAITLCSHDAEVFFHELAHGAHQRVLKARGTSLKGGQVPSQEIVAETVAAVLCRLYGLDGYLYHGAAYVKAYAKGGNPGRAAMKVLADVQATLLLILEAAEDDSAASLAPSTSALVAA